MRRTLPGSKTGLRATLAVEPRPRHYHHRGKALAQHGRTLSPRFSCGGGPKRELAHESRDPRRCHRSATRLRRRATCRWRGRSRQRRRPTRDTIPELAMGQPLVMRRGAVAMLDILGFKGIWKRNGMTPERVIDKLRGLAEATRLDAEAQRFDLRTCDPRYRCCSGAGSCLGNR